MDPGAAVWYSIGGFLILRGLYMFAQVYFQYKQERIK